MASTGLFEFQDLEKIIPDAYHGTDAANIESIQKNGWQIGSGGTLFMGDGVYFYEGSRELATGYPRIRDKNCSKFAVFKCTINLGRCINLTIPEHQKIIEKFQAQLKSYAYNSPEIRKKYDICSPSDVTVPFVLNLAAELSSADTIRGAHGVGTRLFPASSTPILSESRSVIVVRNPKKILATKLVHSENY